MHRTRPPTTFLSAAVVLVLAAAPVAAQDVQYKTISKMDLGGFINAVASLGGGLEVEETTYIKGGMMRTDVDKTSAIMDFENGRYMWLDHEAKTYSVVTIAQMLEMAAQGMAQAKASQPASASGDGSTTLHGDSGDVKLDFQLAVDRTNDSEKVNGWGARRSFITMTTDATVQVEGEEEEAAGSLIVFVDMWSSTDVPAHAATQRLHENAAAQAYLGEAGNAAQSIGAAFASDPQMSAALQKAGEEMQKIEGTPVKTTTYLVALPPTMEFDKDLVLNPAKKESVAKKLGGGLLRGALGRAGQQKEEEEAAEETPQQKTVMTFISEMKDAKAGNLDASLFEPPAGYRQIDRTTGS